MHTAGYIATLLYGAHSLQIRTPSLHAPQVLNVCHLYTENMIIGFQFIFRQVSTNLATGFREFCVVRCAVEIVGRTADGRWISTVKSSNTTPPLMTILLPSSDASTARKYHVTFDDFVKWNMKLQTGGMQLFPNVYRL